MPTQRTARARFPGHRADLATRAVQLGFAGWFAVTVLSQHPHRVFDRLRPLDKVGLLIPNWRFFAPTPARHDFHLLYRTLSDSGERSQWKAASRINPRAWSQVVWFPGRRQEKAVFDICTEITGLVGQRGARLTETPAYRLLRDFVIRHIREEDPLGPRVTGFQFLIVQYSGHDHSEEPQYSFVSPFVPLGERAGGPGPGPDPGPEGGRPDRNGRNGDGRDGRTDAGGEGDDSRDDRLESAA